MTQYKLCLFNVRRDPCEMVNLADIYPDVIKSFESIVQKYEEIAVPPSNVPDDPRANPNFWNGAWVSWQDSDPCEFQNVV